MSFLNRISTNFKILLGITALSLIGTGLLYAALPPTVPIHWNVDGSVNTAGKWFVFITALMPVLIYGARYLRPNEQENLNRDIILFCAAIMITAIHWLVMLYALGYVVNIILIVKILTGAMLTIAGNYLGRIRQNPVVGIRNAWTYADKNVWRKVNRVGGFVFVATGLLVIAAAFLSEPLSAVFSVSMIIFAAVFTFAYSYVVYKKLVR